VILNRKDLADGRIRLPANAKGIVFKFSPKEKNIKAQGNAL